MKDFLKFLLLPFIIYLVTQYLIDNNILSVSYNDALNTINEFAKYACMVFIAIYIISETAGSYIIPHLKSILKEQILPALDKKIDTFTDNFVSAFRDKEFNIKPAIYTNAVEQRFEASSISQQYFDDILIEAQQLVSDDKTHESIELIEDIKNKTDEHYDFLLTRYIATSNSKYSEIIDTLLPKYGKTHHYTRLAFNKWESDDIDKAVTLCEQGYSLCNKSVDKNSLADKKSCMNSLAYYYADGEIASKSNVAYNLIDEVIGLYKSQQDTKSIAYANALDTKGYVMISFGDTENEIREGIADCEKANSLGLNDYLLNRHLAKAYSRLSTLST